MRFGKLFFSALLLATSLIFAIPGKINYQGKLTDGTGVGINGTRVMTFRLYTGATGGTALWTETHAAVNVTKGLFSEVLGETTTLSGIFGASGDYWLEIVVGGETLTPRVKISSVPFALRAGVADSVVGLSASHTHTLTLTGKVTGTGSVTGTITTDLAAGAVAWTNLAGAVQESIRATGSGSSLWALSSGSGLSGEAYRTGRSAVGVDTCGGHMLSAQIPVFGGEYLDHSAVRGVLAVGTTPYAYGELARYNTLNVAPFNFPLLTDYIGVLGVVTSSGTAGGTAAGVYAWNKLANTGSTAYGVYANADGTGGTTHYGIYATATGATNNYAGYFSGDVRVTGRFLDSSGDAGVAGQILSSTGTGTNWLNSTAIDSDWVFLSGSGIGGNIHRLGNVAIGTSSPGVARLHVEGTTNYGIYAKTTATNGNGIYGDGGSVATGVLAISSAPQTDSPSRLNAAVWAQNSRADNTDAELAIGVMGTAKADSNAIGVMGTVLNDYGAREAKGVWGLVHSSNNSYALYGISDATTTTTGQTLFGVYGRISTEDRGCAVYGYAENPTIDVTTLRPLGVAGRNKGAGIGIVGTADDLSPFDGDPATFDIVSTGVAGWALKYGVAGFLDGTGDATAGVFGWWGTNVYGALGYYSTTLWGGSYASVYGTRGTSTSRRWAGYFHGNVYVADTVFRKAEYTLTFMRAAGRDTMLSGISSPSDDVFCRGKATILPSAGAVFVEYPKLFALTADFTKDVDITLSPIGSYAPIYMDSWDERGFWVKIAPHFDCTETVKFSYAVFASRYMPPHEITNPSMDDAEEKRATVKNSSSAEHMVPTVKIGEK